MRSLYTWCALLGIVMRAFPQDLDGLIRQADQFEKNGETDLAINSLRQADQLSVDNPQVEKRLAREYTRKIEDVSDPAARKKYGESSIELAQKAARQLPDDAQARVGLAAAYGKMLEMVNEKTKIEYSRRVYAEATRAVELDPNSDFGHLILARWEFEMASLNPVMKGFAQIVYGRFPPASKEDAIVEFRKAIHLAPERITHHAEFAKVLDALGEKDAACREWMKVTLLKAIDSQDKRYQAAALERLKSPAADPAQQVPLEMIGLDKSGGP
jgi:tetratricopeptide (TPR) repeat protein